MSPTPEENVPVFEFGEFRLDTRERLLFKNGASVALQPKTFELLLAFLRNAGDVVSKETLHKEVWPDTFVSESSLLSNVSLLRTALGDDRTEPRYIKTLPRRGYRFVAQVRALSNEPEPPAPETEATAGRETSQEAQSETHIAPESMPETESETAPAVERLAADAGVSAPPPRSAAADLRRWRLGHILLACSLYALLYAIALFVEVAYEFERLAPIAWRLAPPAFAWIFLSSGAALWTDWRLTRQGKATGMLWSIGIFLVSGFAVAAAVGPYLPPEPVTKASFQTYTAQSAYLKSCYYFLPLVVVYLVIPFHLVVALDEEIRAGNGQTVARLLVGKRSARPPSGAIHLRVWWLAVLLLAVAIVALYGTAHLLERLEPDPNANLFTKLFQARVVTYFLLGSECLVWYYLTLNTIKHEALVITERTKGTE